MSPTSCTTFPWQRTPIPPRTCTGAGGCTRAPDGTGPWMVLAAHARPCHARPRAHARTSSPLLRALARYSSSQRMWLRSVPLPSGGISSGAKKIQCLSCSAPVRVLAGGCRRPFGVRLHLAWRAAGGGSGGRHESYMHSTCALQHRRHHANRNALAPDEQLAPRVAVCMQRQPLLGPAERDLHTAYSQVHLVPRLPLPRHAARDACINRIRSASHANGDVLALAARGEGQAGMHYRA